MAEPHTGYIFMSWNVRGLNNLAKQESVKQVVALHKPLMVLFTGNQALRDLPDICIPVLRS
jgi:hypothetical protein